jgi:hypothetical protein
MICCTFSSPLSPSLVFALDLHPSPLVAAPNLRRPLRPLSPLNRETTIAGSSPSSPVVAPLRRLVIVGSVRSTVSPSCCRSRWIFAKFSWVALLRCLTFFGCLSASSSHCCRDWLRSTVADTSHADLDRTARRVTGLICFSDRLGSARLHGGSARLSAWARLFMVKKCYCFCLSWLTYFFHI